MSHMASVKKRAPSGVPNAEVFCYVTNLWSMLLRFICTKSYNSLCIGSPLLHCWRLGAGQSGGSVRVCQSVSLAEVMLSLQFFVFNMESEVTPRWWLTYLRCLS